MALAVAAIAVDQIAKTWALRSLDDGPVGLVGSVRLALAYNTGAAFGLGGAFVPFLAVAALVVVVLLVTRSEATQQPLLAAAGGLVVGGAFGNLADRLFRSPGLLRGAVVDYIDLRWWPVFNLADVAITFGCVILVWSEWRTRDS